MSTTNEKSESVKVMVRIRPMNQKEKDQNCKDILEINPNDKTLGFIQDQALNLTTKVFQFDGVFGENDTQKEIYERSAFGVIETFIEGYNATVFAYGQTGCGKTHTMLGDLHNEQSKGIIPRACKHILTRIGADKQNIEGFDLSCSFIEIYNEQIYDLLDSKKAKRELKESPQGGVMIKDATQVKIRDLETIYQQLTRGNDNRSVGETAMNKDSSRSHCILTLHLQTSIVRDGRELVKKSKLNLVDLAGSERQTKTQAKGDRLKEANSINLSLSALGNVISALISKKNVHIPYRDSKLTRILQDSLGGNTKTLMMAAVSPIDQSYEETLSTLKYAARASKIKNAPKINEDPKDALIKKYREEILQLKEMISQNHDNIVKNDQKLRSSVFLEDQEESEKVLNEEIYKREVLEQHLQILQEQLVQDTSKKNLNDIKVNDADVIYFNKLKSQTASLESKNDAKKAEKKHEETKKTQKMINQEKINELERQLKEINEDKDYVAHKNLEEANEMTENIHSNEKELNFLKKIVNVIFSEKEISKIFNNTIFNDDDGEFMIPEFHFIYHESKNLPMLANGVPTKDNSLAPIPLRERMVNNSHIKEIKKSSNMKQNEILQIAQNVSNPVSKSFIRNTKLKSVNS